MSLKPQIKYSFGVFLLVAIIARLVQQSPVDIALSKLFFDAELAVFPYQFQAGLDFIGTYIWWVPFGGAVLMAIRAWRYAPASQEQWAWGAGAIFLASGPLLAGVLKHLTAMPRPLHAQVFSGSESMPAYFWAKHLHQAGNALPSAHASAGFVLLAFFFIGCLTDNPRLRILGLWLGLSAGLLFGLMRIVQGYHFFSQVLWSCAVMGLYACLLFTFMQWARDQYLRGRA